MSARSSRRLSAENQNSCLFFLAICTMILGQWMSPFSLGVGPAHVFLSKPKLRRWTTRVRKDSGFPLPQRGHFQAKEGCRKGSDQEEKEGERFIGYLGVYHRNDALPNGQPTLMQTPESGLLQLDMVEDITGKLFRPSPQSDNPPILLPIFQKSCSV